MTAEDRRSRTLRTAVLPAGGLAALAAVAVGAGLLTEGGAPVEPRPPADLGRISTVAFTSFSDCDALLSYYRRHARRLVGPYGLPGSGGSWRGAEMQAADSAGAGGPAVARGTAVPAPAVPAAAADGSASGTGTNVQVAGVDEADLAKRVGDLVLTVAPQGSSPGMLRVLRAGDGTVTPVGRLATGDWQPQQMLVEGPTVLLLGAAPAGPRDLGRDVTVIPPGDPRPDVPGRGRIRPPGDGGLIGPALWPNRTRIVQVDVSDPAKPRQVRSLDVDGLQVGARLSGGVARLTVTTSPSRLPLLVPLDDRPGARDAATAHNRSAVAAAGVDAWLPRYTLVEGSGRPTTGRLLDCDEVAAPDRFSGLETLSMLAFDLRSPGGISRWERGGVVAAGATVYATPERTYVATSPWQEPGPAGISPRGPVPLPARRPAVSQIHAFATEAGAAPRYLASGEVAGALLNQFAMDEHEGHLRVASTVPAGWDGVGGPAGSPAAVDEGDAAVSDGGAIRRPAPMPSQPQRQSESFVTVLRQSGDRLVQTGRVGGLGRDETIRAVRFMGRLGYVVTFRQTDPLYTLDLADPAAPRVTGELKIPGYSAYLHPVGEGMLLGVGQDADSQGMQLGLQMSLFDVSDVAAPRRVAQVRLPGTWSDAEGDHHAFTFAGGLALVPFSGESYPADGRPGSGSWDAGIVAVRVDGSSLSQPSVLRPRLDGPVRMDGEWVGPEMPLRTFVDDGEIVTVTDAGIALHDAGTLRRLAHRAY